MKTPRINISKKRNLSADFCSAIVLVDSNKSEVEKELLLTNSAFVKSYRTDNLKVVNCPHFASSNGG